MARVPIIRVGSTLIATVQEDLRDQDALRLQEDLIGAVERTGAQGVLLDVSVVETLDSFLGRLLGEIALGARLMGAHTVVVGLQPAVAVTLVELGLHLRGVRTAVTADRGLALLKRHVLLKLLLNAHSTLVMGRLGRYEGNLMTWVTPTNGKLVDRAARCTGHLLRRSGVEASYERIVEHLFVEMERAEPGESVVVRTWRALLPSDGARRGGPRRSRARQAEAS